MANLALNHPTEGLLDTGTLSTTAYSVKYVNATGSGTGAGTADTLHKDVRTASGSGGATASDTATRVIIRIRTASDTNGTGGSATTYLAAKQLFLDDTDGQGRLDFNFLSLNTFARLKRTASGSGTGTASAIGARVQAKTATGSGTGSQSSTSLSIRIRSASDTNGTGGSATSRLLKRIVTATGSGTGTESATRIRIAIRTGTASAGTGGYATTNWDILDVVEATNLVVELELTSNPYSESPVFVLDDATTGLLGTGTLGARNFYDVTAFVKEVNIQRGRSRQLDSFNAGTASVIFNDPTRQFDPTNTASIYYGGILPRQPIRISANDIRLFTGYIEDWNLDYTQPTMLTASITCVDGFSLLSAILLEEYATTNGQRSDQRITTVLGLPEVASVVPQTSLETGVATLGDDLIADQTILLDYLQKINRSEQGYLFMDASNKLTFIARGAASSLAVATGAIPVFTDNIQIETDFKYLELGVQFGTELLYNRITVQNVDSAVVQTVNDLGSQTDYLVRTLDLTDLLLETDAKALTLANYVLSQYARPIFRYDSVSVSATGITNNRKNRMFSIGLAQLVRTTRNFAVGSPTDVTRYSLVEGIEHHIDLNSHVIRYSLNTLTYTP